MALLEVYATVADFAEWWSVWDRAIDLGCPEQVAQFEDILKKAAGQINMSLQAAGVGACEITTYGLTYLCYLNIIAAAVGFKTAIGPKLSAEERELFMRERDNQLDLIRKGEIDVCGGTGKNFPAFGSAQQTLTIWNARELIARRSLED